MNIRTFIIAIVLIATFQVSHSAALREHRFELSIKRSALVSVLDQFSQQTGLHIGMEISAVKSRATLIGPFVGSATADEALNQLLGGTDLWYAWRGTDTIRLFLISAQR